MDSNSKYKNNNNRGLLAAFLIITAWISLLFFLLGREINYVSSWNILYILLMAHLYTGIFITAHDAIHGHVSRKPSLNRFIGTTCTLLFAFNSYRRLSAKHHVHHHIPGTEGDPDYYQGSFFPWFFKFMLQYISFRQFLLMGLTYNLAAFYFSQTNLLLFWIFPAILSTFQLFYFGTYLPHRGSFPQSDPHKARSQKPNHFLAFISCYFFGYHHEHHAYPFLPWWKLAEARQKTEKEQRD